MDGLRMCALERFHRQLAARSCCDLAGVLGGLLPKREFAELTQAGTRQRVFTPVTAFWHFLTQILSPNQSCREVVRRVQAQRQQCRRSPISPRTGAYCQARQRLPVSVLKRLWQRLADHLAGSAAPDLLWEGFRVAVIDGTTVSMPDTPANQRLWPQPANQRPGCGFPILKLVAVFSLATGAIHAVITGSMHRAEHALLQGLWPCLQVGFDLLLGDRNFGSYATFCELRLRRMHGVFRLHQGRRMDWRTGQRLGPHDRLVVWRRPVKLPPTCRRPSLPETVTVRVLRVQLDVPGFRTQTLCLATDLTDPRRYSPEALARLYFLRWSVELFFAHIKTAMHMDVLRCQTPAMIRRELHMHFIAYNAIRAVMIEAAARANVGLDRVSFKGTCDALRQFAPHLAALSNHPPAYRRLMRLFLDTLATDLVPLRRPRSEPRVLKRRPKNFHRLTKPRHLMGNLSHRNRPKPER
jgi:hypothetical protein